MNEKELDKLLRAVEPSPKKRELFLFYVYAMDRYGTAIKELLEKLPVVDATILIALTTKTSEFSCLPREGQIEPWDIILVHCPEHGDYNIKVREHLSGEGCPKCSKLASCPHCRTTHEFTVEKGATKH